MLTIDRLAKIDSLAMRIMATLYRGLEWVGDQYEARLVDAAYKVAEAKAAAINKAEDKISDLEDEQARTGADIQDKLASAALALDAAYEAYNATIRAANDKLGVEVSA